MTSSSSAETAKRLKQLIKEPFDIHDFKNLTNAGERQDANRLDELRRILMKLIGDGELDLSGKTEYVPSESLSDLDVKAKWNNWLTNQHSKFVDQLCDRIRLGRKHALRAFCGVIASSPMVSPDKKVMAKTIDGRLVVKLVEALCVRAHFPSKKKIITQTKS